MHCQKAFSKNRYCNKASTKTFYNITFNTIILYEVLQSFWTQYFCISKILIFLDYILSLAKARDKIKSKKAWTFSIKRKFLFKNFITLRANQNNSYWGKFCKNLAHPKTTSNNRINCRFKRKKIPSLLFKPCCLVCNPCTSESMKSRVNQVDEPGWENLNFSWEKSERKHFILELMGLAAILLVTLYFKRFSMLPLFK